MSEVAVLRSRLGVRAQRAGEIARLRGRGGLRRELLTVDYALTVAARRRGADALRLRVGSKHASGTLVFGRRTFSVDRIAYFGVFLERWYRADYEGAVAVDIGAHKGYFGAYALLEGAAEVHSYEPEPSNHAALSEAAASFGAPWVVRAAAVGAATGTAVLHVSAESAGHSLLHEVADGPRRTLAAERVDVISMAAVLERASSRGKPVIVKIDAEGSECEIVLETPEESWASVTEVFLEVHDFAPCSADTIVAKLARCGFEVSRRVADRDAELLALSRR